MTGGGSWIGSDTEETLRLKNELIGSMVSLSDVVLEKGSTDATDDFLVYGLYSCAVGVDNDPKSISWVTSTVRWNRDRVSGGYTPEEPDIGRITESAHARAAIRGCCGLASSAFVAKQYSPLDRGLLDALYGTLSVVAKDPSVDDLRAALREIGRLNRECLAHIAGCISERFCEPIGALRRPKKEMPCLVVTGLDLPDLEELLKQASAAGIGICLSDGMAPAMAIPFFLNHPNLVGYVELDGGPLPAPVLFVSDSVLRPEASDKDMIFTTGPVQFPGCVHIGGCQRPKIFAPALEKAAECGTVLSPAEAPTSAGDLVLPLRSHGDRAFADLLSRLRPDAPDSDIDGAVGRLAEFE